MKKLPFLIVCIIAIVPFVARASDVNYQKIVERRGDTAIVNVYGSDAARYFSCDLSAWNCVYQSTTTPDLFPELFGKKFFLSGDRTLAFVINAATSSDRYSLYHLGSGVIDSLDISGAVIKARFSDDNTRILLTLSSGEFWVFDIVNNIGIRSIPTPNSGSFVTFSPHGNYIAYYTPNTAGDSTRSYSVIDVSGGMTYTWKEKNTYWDLLTEEEKAFVFSPDELQLYYLSDRDGYQTVYVLDLKKDLRGHGWPAGNASRSNTGWLGKRIFKSNFVVNNFLFGNDGRLYFIANRKSPLIWSLYAYDLSDRLVRTIADDVLYYPPMQRVGDHILFLRSEHELPALYGYRTDSGIMRSFPIDDTGSIPLSAGTIKNFNGRYGVLYLPDDYVKKRSYPLIVWLHGGPHRQTAASFHSYRSYGTYDALLEQMRKNGFVVLKLDYHGSYGYGRAFASGLKGKIGAVDVRDVVDATQSIKKELRIGNVYAMGNSYGGYLALRTLAGKPSLFAGAISINGVTDWWTLIKHDPSSIFSVHFNGAPSANNKILYDQSSIFRRINNLRNKKIILVEGLDDDEIPTQQTDMLYQALEDRGATDVQLLSYEKEKHIIANVKTIENICLNVVQSIKATSTVRCAIE